MLDTDCVVHNPNVRLWPPGYAGMSKGYAMARKFNKYQPLSAFTGVLFIITDHELEKLDAFFEQSKLSLRFEKDALEQRAERSGGGYPDDFWGEEFAQLDEFSRLASEFAIIGLWRCVELYRKRAIRHALGGNAVQRVFVHKEFQRKLRSQGIEESQLCCAGDMDELRCLNNAVKHERLVSTELAGFPNWSSKVDKELGDLESHYIRLRPLAKQYLKDLAERLKAKFPPPHRVKNI